MIEYSRDELASPLRALDKVLESVRGGAFEPDSTRSGYWVIPEATQEVVQHGSGSATTEVVGSSPVRDSSVSDSDTASEVVDTEESSGGENRSAGAAVEAAVPADPDFLPEIPDGGLVRNVGSNYLHGVRTGNLDRMLCGRVFPKRHHKLDSWPPFIGPLCRDCFPSKID